MQKAEKQKKKAGAIITFESSDFLFAVFSWTHTPEVKQNQKTKHNFVITHAVIILEYKRRSQPNVQR